VDTKSALTPTRVQDVVHGIGHGLT